MRLPKVYYLSYFKKIKSTGTKLPPGPCTKKANIPLGKILGLTVIHE